MTCATFRVFQYILSHQRNSKRKISQKEKKGHSGNLLSQKSRANNSGPAGPATTALAIFPTGGHKAARHIQGNMSKTNTNKEVPPWNGQLENYWREKLDLVSQASKL